MGLTPMKINHESLTGTFEQQRELVRSFNLMDDDFFAVVMQDKKAFEVMLRILTQRNDLIVKEVRTQYNIRNLVGHSVILDGFAEDSQGKLYNVEVQVENNDYHPKRIRYYQSNIDMSMFEKGKKYSELLDLYLIFISEFDMFRKNQSHYEVERTLKGFDDYDVSNGVHELYFNTAVKDDTEISEFLQYFKNSDSSNDKYASLSSRVKYCKETEEGVKRMCEAVRNYGDERAAKAKAEGEALNRVKTIKTLIKNTGCTLEEALSMIGCTLEEYNNSLEIAEKINK